MHRVARLIMYVNTAAIVLALGKYHAAFIGEYDFTGSSRLAWSLAYIGLLCAAAYGVGLPELPGTAYQAFLSGAGAALGAAVAMSVVQLVVGNALLPRFVVFWSALLVVPSFAMCAFVAAKDRRRRAGRDRVVAVIGREEAVALERELGMRPERPASLVRALRLSDACGGTPDGEPLVKAAVDARCTVLVLDRAAQSDEAVVAQAASLHERGVRVRTLSLFYDEWLGKLPVSELERISLMFDIGEVHRARYLRLKRLLDVSAAVAGFPFFVVMVPVVLTGNLVANRGPLLYRQHRVGKGGKEFVIRKFRTMRAGGVGTDWTADDDPRVTTFGRVLRRSHIDELPQVINIFKGDLSIVGPRPEQPRYVEDLLDKIAFYGLRHLVRPGLTGWAQVKYPYGANEIDAIEKLQYEFYYLRHQGLTLDLRIMGRTVRSVIGGGGR